MKKFNIYVLELVKNKFYVGKTFNNVSVRYKQHENGKGSMWTRMFRPIRILEHYETINEFEEDMMTKKYMNKYGIDNVRGGTYVKIELEPYEIKAITQELKSSNNLCFRCGSKNHFVSNCPIKKIF
jgi:predicted GIY-YIG superfamily endonuclease